MSFKEILLYIIIPIGVAIVSSLLITFFKWIKPIVFKERLVIKELKNSEDNDINEFVALYNEKINERLRICAEQIVEFTDNIHDDGIDHHLFICKHKDNVVGFIKVIVSYPHNFLFIAYIAIDNSDPLALKYGVSSLVDKILKKYIKGDKKIFNIFTEIERSVNNGYITPLYKNIVRRCKNHQLTPFLIDFDYIQPNMPDDNYNVTHEDVLSLIWIPKKKPNVDYLNKKEVIKFCKYIYEDIYLPSCEENNCSENYLKYLNNLYERYDETLPDSIKLINMIGE